MEPGNLIAGRYRLEQRLAAGGMGEVWRGTDTRLNRVVAIKLLHAGLSGNDRFRARFHQEAQAVAALQSPGIVALYDYGEEHGPEGLVSYLIMELVRGQALDNVLRQRGRLSPAETLRIVAAAADALDVAHRAHIIHRDIKPGNLLIDPEGGAKIVDFGIASARGQAGLTETGTVMGTLAYASPEQLAGRELTGATDVYSLGIVAYECLSGRPPFSGSDPAAIITGHMTGQPAPLPPDIPGPVGQIIMRCLAKDPSQRFASAAELARVCRAGGMGGGTTAILSPMQSSPPNSQATRVMSPGAAPAMAAGVAQAHTSPQPAYQDEYGAATGQFGAGPDDPPLPPPREAEEAKRNPTGPILVVVAGIAVLVAALVIWGPWGGDDDKDLADENSATAEATTDEAPEETTAEQEQTAEQDANTDDGGGNDDQNNGSNGGNDDTDEGPELYELDDYIGENLNEVIAELQGDGLTNLFWNVVTPEGEFVSCEIISQSVPEGREISEHTQLTFTYVNTDDSCLPENRG
ncbi:serine/threonine protein kinase [Glycomyces sp. NRRL B-16210]|uniref:serine/threonine protein kinase n=1 Tax=Glycomyces sp. NRRL B-16210 TaxID=1463821 RepID=UPI000689DEC1|nr:serine/threonine protein kinase [Glycomyces sp. NRRL B-16210]